MKNKFTLVYIGWFVCLSLQACDGWLGVKPDDEVTEKDVFKSVEGFRNALNAIYIEMNASSLYGESLGSELTEVLAHRYNVHIEAEEMRYIFDHSYQTAYARRRFDDIWTSAYALIGNINQILKNCDAHKDVLQGINYHIIKGEALALRGYLHFDLFRLFGPVYVADTAAISLPYNRQFAFIANELLPGYKFLNLVIDDLKEAEELLQADPIVENGPSWSEDLYDPFRDRVSRLNYYALLLLRARVELYAGHRAEALNAARKVIEVQERYFPFTPAEKVSANMDNPDCLFSSELLFALENPQRVIIFNSLFNPENVKIENLLLPRENKVNYIFQGETDRDYRYRVWFSQVKTISGVNHRVFRKFAETGDTRLKFNTLLPMLRVTEAYYIAAECEENPENGLKYLNMVRNHRGLESAEEAYLLKDLLTSEYIREFWGEGQLFFYYKRLNERYILDADSDWENNTISMNTDSYRIPLPESEMKYRETDNK